MNPWVVQIFWPLMTHSSPSSTALVDSAGQVRPGVGLAEALAPGDLAREDLGQEELLLLLGPPLQDGRAHQGVAEEVGPQRRTGPGELLVEHDRLHGGQALAPVLGGPAWRRSSRPRTGHGSSPSGTGSCPPHPSRSQARTSPAAGEPPTTGGSRRGRLRLRPGSSGPCLYLAPSLDRSVKVGRSTTSWTVRLPGAWTPLAATAAIMAWNWSVGLIMGTRSRPRRLARAPGACRRRHRARPSPGDRRSRS